MKTDDKLIFLHLPKNGGMTFHSILDRLYPKDQTFTIKVVNHTRLNTEDFINMEALKREKIRLLKGHMRFGLHQYMGPETKYITFLRKPEDRIVSYYYYVLRRPKHRLAATIRNQNMSLLDFVTNMKQGDINNAQVRWISGIDDTQANMLDKALENIEKHFSFVGITEMYDQSLVLLQKQMAWDTPWYITQNKTKDRPKVKELDSKTLVAINSRNNADNILYAKMKEKLSQQIENMPGYALRELRLNTVNKIHNSSWYLKMEGGQKKKPSK